ncbi:hypothetical protein MPNT_10393 [Candidatus Methylacidithermus pantelleriae]|uniref:Uncharacterized protein n=1 Tax=Candidatus Methylacidithermus pantelleriae TaxID=2744239 RepID=A0A8J2FRS4_9BACT|nr:hypothetical protein MPNT_10393 [Candidatus Methylacidithermus pantelleriae]
MRVGPRGGLGQIFSRTVSGPSLGVGLESGQLGRGLVRRSPMENVFRFSKSKGGIVAGGVFP